MEKKKAPSLDELELFLQQGDDVLKQQKKAKKKIDNIQRASWEE